MNGNGNGTKKFLAAIGATVLASFLCFTSWWIFIHTPDVYATKYETECLRRDMREDLQYIRERIDRALERRASEDDGTVRIQEP